MARATPKNKAAPTAAATPAQFAGVERLREARVRPERDSSLAPEMDRAIREAAVLRRAAGGCAAAWCRLVPEGILRKTALEGVSRGVLTVRVPDAATRFELDRWLRSGGQKELVGACRAGLSRVKIVIGQ